MTGRPTFLTHEAYLAAQTPAVQALLQQVQHGVEQALPMAQRCISYGMPAYRDGKVFFYFAGFKHHLGVYPPVRQPADLLAELAPYRNEKGNLSFPYRQPIPLALIVRVAVALHQAHGRQP